ncbi:hypothetical protein SRHO_G00118580 [Serrasalmus rhombeus]
MPVKLLLVLERLREKDQKLHVQRRGQVFFFEGIGNLGAWISSRILWIFLISSWNPFCEVDGEPPKETELPHLTALEFILNYLVMWADPPSFPKLLLMLRTEEDRQAAKARRMKLTHPSVIPLC